MNRPPLGWCICCRYAAAQGKDNNPFEPAEYMVMGMGMCPTCALSVMNAFVSTPQLTAILNVTGRRPPPSKG